MTTATTGVDTATLLTWYEQMALIRATEKAAHDLFLRGLVKGTTHLGGRARGGRGRNQRSAATGLTTCSPPTAGITTRWPAVQRRRSVWRS